MSRVCLGLLFGAMLVLSGGLVGQEPRKETTQPAKKDEPVGKAKGMIPQGWGVLKLTAVQKQEIYKIQNKYNSEIAKLEEKIAELKAVMAKERLEVLTPQQKKQLAESVLGKDK